MISGRLRQTSRQIPEGTGLDGSRAAPRTRKRLLDFIMNVETACPQAVRREGAPAPACYDFARGIL